MRKVMQIDPLTNDPTTPVRLENLGDQMMIWNHPELWAWLDWDLEDSDNITYYDKNERWDVAKHSCELACLVQ